MGVVTRRTPAERADARVVEDRFFLPDAFDPALAFGLPRALPAGPRLGDRESRDGPVKARAVLDGQLVEQAPVGRQPLEQIGRGDESLVE